MQESGIYKNPIQGTMKKILIVDDSATAKIIEKPVTKEKVLSTMKDIVL